MIRLVSLQIPHKLRSARPPPRSDERCDQRDRSMPLGAFELASLVTTSGETRVQETFWNKTSRHTAARVTSLQHFFQAPAKKGQERIHARTSSFPPVLDPAHKKAGNERWQSCPPRATSQAPASARAPSTADKLLATAQSPATSALVFGLRMLF